MTSLRTRLVAAVIAPTVLALTLSGCITIQRPAEPPVSAPQQSVEPAQPSRAPSQETPTEGRGEEWFKEQVSSYFGYEATPEGVVGYRELGEICQEAYENGATVSEIYQAYYSGFEGSGIDDMSIAVMFLFTMEAFASPELASDANAYFSR